MSSRPFVVNSDRRSSADYIEHPRQRREVSTESDLSNHSAAKGPFDKLRVTVTQIILVRWDHRVYTGDPILHGDPFDDKAQELLTLVEGQGG